MDRKSEFMTKTQFLYLYAKNVKNYVKVHKKFYFAFIITYYIPTYYKWKRK